MANAAFTTNRFDNLSDEMLADVLGKADALSKAAADEVASLKEEIKRRGLKHVVGHEFTVTVTEQIAGRLDTAAIKTALGDAWRRFEVPTISNVIRIKAAHRLAFAS